jgi:hypothetical protein
MDIGLEMHPSLLSSPWPQDSSQRFVVNCYYIKQRRLLYIETNWEKGERYIIYIYFLEPFLASSFTLSTMQNMAMMKLGSVRLPLPLQNTIEELLKGLSRKNLKQKAALLRWHLRGYPISSGDANSTLSDNITQPLEGKPCFFKNNKFLLF